MIINEKNIRLAANDKTTVLILTVKIPCGISARADKFYSDAAEEFEKSVREHLHPKAKEAYESDTDRRKRYRYVPWNTGFICLPKAENQIEMTLHANGNILRKETHYWHENELLKREKMKV